MFLYNLVSFHFHGVNECNPVYHARFFCAPKLTVDIKHLNESVPTFDCLPGSNWSTTPKRNGNVDGHSKKALKSVLPKRNT